MICTYNAFLFNINRSRPFAEFFKVHCPFEESVLVSDNTGHHWTVSCMKFRENENVRVISWIRTRGKRKNYKFGEEKLYCSENKILKLVVRSKFIYFFLFKTRQFHRPGTESLLWCTVVLWTVFSQSHTPLSLTGEWKNLRCGIWHLNTEGILCANHLSWFLPEYYCYWNLSLVLKKITLT